MAEAPTPSPPASTASLEAALHDLTLRCVGGTNASLQAFNALTEGHLAKQDETSVLVDSARLEIQHTTDVAFAALLAQTRVRAAVASSPSHCAARSLLTAAAPLPPPPPPFPLQHNAGGERPVRGH